MGVSNVSEPRHKVAIQQKNKTAKGSEINMVLYMKYSCPPVDMPLVNMWCAHTMTDRPAMAHME
jgi:hypothetical protein